MSNPKTVQGALVGRLIPAFIHVLGKQAIGVELEGLRKVLLDASIVLDKLKPSALVDEIVNITFNEVPALRNYLSVVLFFYSLKKIIQISTGDYLQGTSAYVIEKVADVVEYFAWAKDTVSDSLILLQFL